MGDSAPAYTVPLLIKNKDQTSSNTYAVTSPQNLKVCWHANAISADGIPEVVESAANGFKLWRNSKPAARQTVLFRAADLMEERADELAGYMQTEMGADVGASRHMIIPMAIMMLRDIASRLVAVCGSVPTSLDEGMSAMVLKEPYGVVLGITAWNAPPVFGVRSIATAVATGNATIIKASERSPRCYHALGKIFCEAGLPEGVLSVVSCPSESAAAVTKALIEHPVVKKVNFTGSAQVGRQIGKICGENLKPVLMELGGKNRAIVLRDADLKKAASACLLGGLINAGQICMSTDIVLVDSSIAKDFAAALKTGLAEFAKGQPIPKVISAESQARLKQVTEKAVQSGAGIISGGQDPPPDEKGSAVVPTILSNLNEKMEYWSEEAFGPIFGIKEFETEEEALKIVNESNYGLSASVFTENLRKGFAIAKKIETGAVHINTMTIHDEPQLPFGGVKNSGWGRFNSKEGMEEFLVTKTITWDD